MVTPEDRLTTMFRTKWGTYSYRKMPFGLINAGASFQCAMDIAFRGLLGRFVVVYLDDVMVFSKKRKEHIIHLKQIFDRCRRYGISLNPKKSILCATEGKLLGFVVSKDGMMIDLEREEVICKLPPPHNKKSMQSFMGKINFVCRFIPNFAEMVKPLQHMVKQKVEYKWETAQREAFVNIKEAIANSP